MRNSNQNKGMSRLVVLVMIAAIALVGAIIIPIVMKEANETANETDAYYVSTAKREAKVEFLQTKNAVEKVFDTETKKFVDPETAKKTVNPYGTSKEHQGMYLLVKVDEEGNITTTWIKP